MNQRPTFGRGRRLARVLTRAAISLTSLMATHAAAEPRGSMPTTVEANLYKNAFDVDGGQPSPNAIDVHATSISVLQPLMTQSSFPARVHVGAAPAQVGDTAWPTANAYVPKPVEHTFKRQGCEITIRTGEFALRTYDRRHANQYAVDTDALQSFTTLEADKGSELFVSVTTDLIVDVPKAKQAACRNLIGGRDRLAIGQVSLDDFGLRLSQPTPNDAAAATVTVRDAKRKTLYITYDTPSKQFQLVELGGLAPTLESSIFSLTAAGDGEYFVELRPSFALDQRNTVFSH
jgi:hypothetical protein